MVTNNAAAALGVPLALDLAKKMELESPHSLAGLRGGSGSASLSRDVLLVGFWDPSCRKLGMASVGVGGCSKCVAPCRKLGMARRVWGKPKVACGGLAQNVLP